MSSNRNKLKLPYISIIIPVLNGENHIDKCLDSIFKINYPGELYEVIVVDNGSTDNTLNIAREYNAKILIKPNVNVSSLRNYGARYSKGEMIAFIDSDCVVIKEWINNALKYFNQENIGMVGSLVRAPMNCNWVGKVWDICYEKRRLLGETDRLGSGNMIMKKEYFIQLQGFDENLISGEDDDICYRLRIMGYKIYSDPAITAYHYGDCKSLFKFFTVEVWRGCETFNLFLKNKGRMNSKIIIYAFFYLIITINIFLSLVFVLIFRTGYFTLILLILLLLAYPFYIAIKTAIISKNWGYLFHYALLYLTLGIARALSIFRVKLR